MKSAVLCQYVITIRVSDVFGVFSADGDQHRCGPGHPGRPLHHQDQPDHAQAREKEDQPRHWGAPGETYGIFFSFSYVKNK